MQKILEKQVVDVLQKNWVMHISTDGYRDDIPQLRVVEGNKPVAQILQRLGFSPKLTGYRCLLCVIPMLAGDPCLLMKEVYPVVAKQCGLNDYRCVERTIRSAIRKAWENRDDAVWSQYFPRNKTGEIIRPTNKEFIARLAEEL